MKPTQTTLKTMLLMALAWLMPSMMRAQGSYRCDFENEDQNKQWVLNPAATSDIYDQLTNRWYIGKPGNNGGENGLYISDDMGKTAHYAATESFVVAYTTVTLEASTAGYQMSFDYRGGGTTAEGEGMFVFWIPENDRKGSPIEIISLLTNAFPSGYAVAPNDYSLKNSAGTAARFAAAPTWKQALVTIPAAQCDGQPHRLAFAWKVGKDAGQQPGACVDNIEIVDDRVCTFPKNLKAEAVNHSALFTWDAVETATQYEVTAYSYTDSIWYGPMIVNENKCTISNITAGYCTFYVRSLCGDERSIKTSFSTLIYYPEDMCVNYLDLNKATCYIADGKVEKLSSFNKWIKTAPIDTGYQSISSRHTVHSDPFEYDIRTGNMLKTVPEGELASVRLGNWNINAQGERIDFTFDIDTVNFPVLILKYAVVIEAPGHGVEDDPRFKLDILIDGNSIGSCGQADFNANDVFIKGGTDETGHLKPNADPTWHYTPSSVASVGGGRELVWKDWTTVAVNLRNKIYQGKKVTVSLSTFDCTAGGHAGYAYFTLGCSDGQLKGMKCGVINPTFEAPDGFAYRWFLRSDEGKRRLLDGGFSEQYIKGRGQVFEAGYHDDRMYAVDCMYKEDTTCYYTLYASSLAHKPVPIISNVDVQQDCQNDRYLVTFSSENSYVQEINHVTNDTIRMDDQPTSVRWSFGDDGGVSYERKPTHVFPREGGEYEVKLHMNYLTCEEEVTYHLWLPYMGPVRDTLVQYLCDKDHSETRGYTWAENGKRYTNYALDSVVYLAKTTGCDSIKYLDLREPARDTVRIRIFDYETLSWRGGNYSQAGTYLYSTPSCDSALVLILRIYEPLRAEAPKELFACHGDETIEVPYIIKTGEADGYVLSFENSLFKAQSGEEVPEHIEVDIPATAIPNIYPLTLVLQDSVSGDVVMPMLLYLRYNANVIAQRWDNVLGIRNAEYNGGFEFSAYQWYENGQILDGDTASILYRPLKETNYSALLTRADDMVALMTCDYAVTLTNAATQPTLSTLVTASSEMPLPQGSMGVAYWSTLQGVRVLTCDLGQGDALTSVAAQNNIQTVPTPSQAGVYLLTWTDAEGMTHTNRVIVR